MSELGELLIGHVLGERYRVEEVLGEGGFGVVCRATDLRPGASTPDVAVKVLKLPGWLRGEQRERMRGRFRHEAAYAARLPPHPNVVPVLDFGSYRGRIDYLVMELLRGEDLRSRLERPEPVPLPQALSILRDSARGLSVGHQAGLVHRDVKPGNLWLGTGDDGGLRVRVLDFGIAKEVDAEEGEETATHVTLIGEGVFSRFYAAPEQLRRESVTRAADVFSLGVVAFELLTRTRLFTQEDQGRREAGLPVPMPSLRARNAEIPESVERLVRKCLAERPEDRFAHAGALAEALHRECCRLREPATTSGSRDDTMFAPPPPSFGPEIDLGGETAFQPADGDGPPLDATVLDEEEATRLLDELKRGTAGASVADGTAVDGSVDGTAVDGAAVDAPPGRIRWPFGWITRRKGGPPPSKARRAATMGLAIVLGGSVLGTGFAAAVDGGLIDRVFGGSSAAPAGDARALNAEGLQLFRERQYEDALQRFRRALEITPRHPEYWNNYGYTLVRLRRFSEAAQVLGSLVAAHPDRGVAYSNLAEAQLASGDTAAAVGTLERLLAAGPSDRLRTEAETLLGRLRPTPLDEIADPWGMSDTEPYVAPDPDEERSYDPGDDEYIAPGETAYDTIDLPSGARVAVPRAAPLEPRR